MIIIGKTFSFEAAHCLEGHPKCGRVHGHTYRITIEIAGDLMGNSNMVMDLHELSRYANELIYIYDHSYINDQLGSQPTCEHISRVFAKYISQRISEHLHVYSVTVQEGDGGYARWQVS